MCHVARTRLLALLSVCFFAAVSSAAEPEQPVQPQGGLVDQLSLDNIEPTLRGFIPPTPPPVAERQADATVIRETPVEVRLRRIERALDQLESRIESLQQVIQRQGQGLGADRRNEPNFRGLYMVNRDGTGAEFVVAAPGMIVTSDATWSHDGTQLAMNGLPEIDAFTKSKLFIYTPSGPSAGTIRDLGYGNTPNWSPDDRRIAYMLNPGNPGGIPDGLWVMNADGTGRRRIGRAWYPRWSPDGTLLCCHGWSGTGGATLVLFDPDTGDSRQLLEDSGWRLVDYGGAWSADGKRIAFVGEHGGGRHLATIDVDGSNESIRILFTNTDSDLQMFGPPSWSPDGRQIIFGMQNRRPGARHWWKSNLYSMAPDIPCAPALLEGRPVGNINRVGSWTPDSSKFIFSSER